jgi:hypothetical protein
MTTLPVRQPARAREAATQPGIAAVVHPYSTGRLLPAAFAARGWPAVAVIPDHPLEVYDHASVFRPEEYDAIVGDSGDVMATAAGLAALGVTAVIAGTESGVALADALACHLGLPGNDPATSARRRDKGLMAGALAQAGLAHPRTLRARTAAQARAAAAELGGTVVVKPAASAASDHVTVCRTPLEVTAAWRAAAGQPNLMGLVNDELLIQELLTGQQYTVNTVTYSGPGGVPAHYVSEVWLDCRREVPGGEVPGGKVIYDRMDLLAGDDPRALEVGAYMAAVLDALGLTCGPAHSELMMTGRGPVLIETNARLAGMVDHAAMRRALPDSHVGLAVEAIADPAGFARRRGGRPYRRLAHAVQLDLAADRPGILHAGTLAAIRALPTVCGWVGHATPGERVERTVDLSSSPGMLYLAGPPGQVEADVAAIRALETELYR